MKRLLLIIFIIIILITLISILIFNFRGHLTKKYQTDPLYCILDADCQIYNNPCKDCECHRIKNRFNSQPFSCRPEQWRLPYCAMHCPNAKAICQKNQCQLVTSIK